MAERWSSGATSHAALVEQAPDQARRALFDDIDDLAFGPAAPVDARRPHQGAVAVHELAHLALGQEDIAATTLAFVRHGKTKTVAVARNLATDQV